MKKDRFSHQDAGAFFRSLSLLLRGGIGLADGLFLLAREETPCVAAQLEAMGRQLDAGMDLSTVLDNSGSFEQYALGMVRVGEATGKLEESLDALGAFYEEQVRFRQKLKHAIAYPGTIFVLMLLVVGVLLVEVLPVFDGVYASLGGHLTGIGAGLLGLGMGLKAALPVLFWSLLGLAAAVLLAWKSKNLRVCALGILRRYFGDRYVFRKFNNARFVRGLSMGLCSGLQTQEAVELASMLLRHIPEGAKRCERVKALLETGASLPETMEGAQILSASASRMLAVGIHSGHMDQVMEQLASIMEEEAENALDEAVSQIEPAMVFAGAMLVGAILLAVMVPLIHILSAIG